MYIFESEINNKKVKLYSNYPLKNAATAVLRTLNMVSKQTNIFNPTFALNYGWARFFLSKRTDKNNAYYLVQTADYKNNPMELRTDDCTDALVVQNMQVDTNMKANVPRPEPTLYSDTILVLKEAINAPDVYMNRSDKTKNGDSGWYFGLLNDEREGQHENDEFVTVPTSELMKFRGEALRVLQMPVGTLAVFHDNEMTALVDKDDKPLEFTTSDDRKRATAARKAAEAAAEADKSEKTEDTSDGEA